MSRDVDVIDVTAEIQRVAKEARVSEGQALVFVRGSTAAMEFEPGGVHDLRATLVGPSEALPVLDGRLAIGTWQQLALIDFDDRPRKRTVVVQITS